MWATVLIRFSDQWFVAEINQDRMVLEVKPATEDVKTAVLRPSLRNGEPGTELLGENLAAQFPQHRGHVLVPITLRDQVDGWLAAHFFQRQITAGGIGRVQPFQEGLLWSNYQCGSVQCDHGFPGLFLSYDDGGLGVNSKISQHIE